MKKVYFLIAVLFVALYELIGAMTNTSYAKVGTYYFGENTDNITPAVVRSGEGVLYVVGKTEMFQFNELGEKNWRKEVFSSGALLASCDDSLGVCDRNTGELYILSYDGEILFHSSKHGRAKNLKAFDGSYAIETAEGIYIYSKSSNKVYFVELQPGDLIDFGYSDQHKKIAVLSLDSNVNCYINLLSVTGDITAGKIMLDGLVFGVSLDEDSIRMLKDDGITEFDYFLEEKRVYWEDEEEAEIITVPDSKQLAMDKESESSGGDSDVVYSYNFEENILCGEKNGELALWSGSDKLFDLEEPVKKVVELKKGYLVKNMDGTVCILNHKGEVKQVLSTQDVPLDIIKISNRAFVLVYSNRIDFYRR